MTRDDILHHDRVQLVAPARHQKQVPSDYELRGLLRWSGSGFLGMAMSRMSRSPISPS